MTSVTRAQQFAAWQLPDAFRLRN